MINWSMFSKTCEYGIRAVLYIAAHTDAERPEAIGIRTIAESLEVPVHFLSKILQTLAKHKLLSSVKGPKGGFYLSKAQRNKTPLKIVETIDGDELFKKCGLGLKYCSDSKPCPVHFEYVRYREGIKSMLYRKTIQEMAGDLGERKSFI